MIVDIICFLWVLCGILGWCYVIHKTVYEGFNPFLILAILGGPITLLMAYLKLKDL